MPLLDEAINKPVAQFIPPPAFRGLAAGNDAMAAAAPVLQAGAGVMQKAKQDTQEAEGRYIANYQQQQASEFKKLMATGPEGIRAYIADVAHTNPELAAQFGKELTAFEPYYKNPNLTPADGLKMTEMIFKSYNNRLTAANKPVPLSPTEIHQKNRDYDIANPLPKGPRAKSAAELNQEKRKKDAELAIPGIWRQIEDITQKAEGDQIELFKEKGGVLETPLIPGTARPDVSQLLDEDQRKELNRLHTLLNKHELAAGMKASGTVFGPVDDNPSYSLYKSSSNSDAGDAGGDIDLDGDIQLDEGGDAGDAGDAGDGVPFPEESSAWDQKGPPKPGQTYSSEGVTYEYVSGDYRKPASWKEVE